MERHISVVLMVLGNVGGSTFDQKRVLETRYNNIEKQGNDDIEQYEPSGNGIRFHQHFEFGSVNLGVV